MSYRLAVIDLGTNTFHLLIVEIPGTGKWKFLARERVFVNLASEGIEKISDAAMQRGLATLARFTEHIRMHQAGHVVAIGTAALREASNAGLFIGKVLSSTGIRVEVIDGLREAELITKGVLAALPKLNRPALIMDIGGGSVEMILVNDNAVLFAQSYPVGVAVLHDGFHNEEPISKDSIEKLDIHLEQTLHDLLVYLKDLPQTVLVGASGTFEVIEAILDPRKDPDITPYSTARPAAFTPIYHNIVALDLQERLASPDIPESRARYIVVALHLIEFVLSKVSRDVFYISDYAMKEGMVEEESERVRENMRW